VVLAAILHVLSSVGSRAFHKDYGNDDEGEKSYHKEKFKKES
jgi:hypothetical protein